MSWSPAHLTVWLNSMSNALPVGAITWPSGKAISNARPYPNGGKVPLAMPMTSSPSQPLNQAFSYGQWRPAAAATGQFSGVIQKYFKCSLLTF